MKIWKGFKLIKLLLIIFKMFYIFWKFFDFIIKRIFFFFKLKIIDFKVLKIFNI